MKKILIALLAVSGLSAHAVTFTPAASSGLMTFYGYWESTAVYPYNMNVGTTKTPVVVYKAVLYIAESVPTPGMTPNTDSAWTRSTESH